MTKRIRLTLVFAGLLALGLVAGACGDEDSDEPAPTSTSEPTSTGEPTATTEPATSTPEPTATPTVLPAACPGDEIACDFARQLDDWMASADVASIVGVSAPTEIECPDPSMQGEGGPYPLCGGADEGDLRSGYQVAVLQSEGAVIDADGLTQLITDWLASADPSKSDDFGSGEVRLVTFGCPGSEAGEAICTGDFAVTFNIIISPDEGVTVRKVLVYGIDRSGPDGAPRIRTVLSGGRFSGSGEGFGSEFLTGGPSGFSVTLAPGLPKAEFFAWTP